MYSFVTNSAQTASQFQNNVTPLTPQQLLEILEYACVEGTVAYSSLLTNGATFQTVQGKNMTMTVQNGTTYVDNAKLIRADILVSNGVIQVLDRLVIYKVRTQHGS